MFIPLAKFSKKSTLFHVCRLALCCPFDMTMFESQLGFYPNDPMPNINHSADSFRVIVAFYFSSIWLEQCFQEAYFVKVFCSINIFVQTICNYVCMRPAGLVLYTDFNVFSDGYTSGL